MVSATSSRGGGGPARHAPRGGAGPGSPRVSAQRRRWWWAAPPSASGASLERVALAFFLASVALVLSCALYLYVFRYLGRGSAVAGFVGEDLEPCDVFDGAWVPDAGYPLYNSSLCPFAERGFNCLANGRKDTGYLKWRWKPRRCDAPRFTARAALERLRGKRVLFVGDSMSRTQWESFICMLMAGVDDPKTVYEVNGNEITKTIRSLSVRFASFDLTVEFFRSVFLVQQRAPPRHAPKRVKSTLRLDSDTNQKVCEVTEQPSSEAKGNDKSEFGTILADVVANMNVPVTLLNVTLMGAFRSDAHVGTWSYPPTVLDCSHWCLPGVPDAWNELVFSYLLTNGWRKMAR